MKRLFQITALAHLHQTCIHRWKETGVFLQESGFFALVEENHAFNFQLWHAEDKARREDMGFEWVYSAKRDIDRYNQERNNRMEAIDAWLQQELHPSQDPSCPVHSETPGMIIDRLSILSLKIYHMAIQATRQDVSKQHREQCQGKWQTLLAQQAQLHRCLEQLCDEILAKTRTFRTYHQFKMYNDPSLNPELYAKTTC